MRELPCTVVRLILLLILPAAAATGDEITYRKSWIAVDASCNTRVLEEGETWEIPVDYYLHPSEARGGTSLSMWIAGPFIDVPDGKYTKKRHHVSLGRNMTRSVKIRPGRGHHTFTYTVPPTLPRNRLLILCYFVDADGKRWPWEVRRDNIWYRRRGGFFELETDRPGSLFRYQDSVEIRVRLRNVERAGAKKTLTYTVRDTTGAEVARGERTFRAARAGQVVSVPLDLKTRGTFLFEADVAGWEKRATTFCRIPDVVALTGDQPTRFGMTNVVAPQPRERLEAKCRIARCLGLTSCRLFAPWYELEPGPGVFRLQPHAEALAIGQKQGIDTWLCITSPPPWALRGTDARFRTGYRAFRCDLDAWRDFVKATTTRLRGRFSGWEWLNEITPGGTPDPVTDYVTLARIGTETARQVAPGLRFLLAGGLWPRSFRLQMLKAGVGEVIDVLPVHYANGGAVREAREDLAAAGLDRIRVWDNESARGVNTWNVPLLEQLTDTRQSEWVLSQWTDELAAGCERIIYFGGAGSPCGNFDYIHDDLSPRPVAATLAVLTSVLHDARPVGTFTRGRAALFHLFQKHDRVILVASSYEPGETVRLHTGAGTIRVTDAQGNTRSMTTPGGVAELTLSTLACFVEGADPDVLKAYTTLTVDTPRAARKRTRLAEVPRLTVVRGTPGELRLTLLNCHDRALSGSVRVAVPEGWTAEGEMAFSLKAGQRTPMTVTLTAPEATPAGEQRIAVTIGFDDTRLPAVTHPAVVSVITPDRLGNRLVNGGFEEPDPARRSGPRGWRVNHKTSRWTPAAELGPGLGKHVLEFTATGKDYGTTSQTVELEGGQTYLYTAWVWNRNMTAGSNVTLRMIDGSVQRLYDVHVFTCGMDNAYWQMYACRLKTPPGLKSASFTPLARGEGRTFFDNIRVTRFQGTDYAAEAHACAKPPRIDGRLDDWITLCPLPLLGRNQLTVRDRGYVWTPENLSAVGYVTWDRDNLYVAVSVRDDVHVAPGTGEDAIQGDGLILALDPANRQDRDGRRAFAYYVSSASPGGGSGKHTLYRPPHRAGRTRAGQLAKDSSVYDLAIRQDRGTCTYELRIPFAELGGIAPAVGTSFGFSVQLNDRDEKAVAAHMSWGEGVSPAWHPARFGVVTLVE